MTGDRLGPLMDVPEDVRLAGEVVAGFDRCLVAGFGRLGPDQAAALDGFVRALADSPIGGALGESYEALKRLEFVERHFVVLAAARASIQAAQYDALRSALAGALGRDAPDGSTPAQPTPPDDAPDTWKASARHWLMELALAGFRNLDESGVAPFASTLAQIRGEPRHARPAALLSGFRDELLGAMPIATLPTLPSYRWADLWSRGLIATLGPPGPPAAEAVDGRLCPIGVDLRHHGTFASADVYALLGRNGRPPRVVRTTASSPKVDAVAGPGLWACVGPGLGPLLDAVAGRKAVEISGATLLGTGDLLLDGEAKPAKAFDAEAMFAESLGDGAVETPVAMPADRHPVQIAEPVLLDGYKVNRKGELTLEWDDVRLPIAANRLSTAIAIGADEVAKSGAMAALLRFDGGRWSAQPLAVREGAKGAWALAGPPAGSGPKKGKKKGGDSTLDVLRERAGRLLRAKA